MIDLILCPASSPEQSSLLSARTDCQNRNQSGLKCELSANTQTRTSKPRRFYKFGQKQLRAFFKWFLQFESLDISAYIKERTHKEAVQPVLVESESFFEPFQSSVNDSKDQKDSSRKSRALIHEKAGRLPALKEAEASSILDEYGNSLLRLAYSYVHNVADAQEIVQDVLVQFFKKDPVFESPLQKKSWLFKVCSNLSKNKLRFNKLRHYASLDVLAEKELKHEPDLSFIWCAVKSLPMRYSEAIYLYYHDGFTTEEIAGILGITPSAVRSRLQRARSMLKEILQKEDQFYE